MRGGQGRVRQQRRRDGGGCSGWRRGGRGEILVDPLMEEVFGEAKVDENLEVLAGLDEDVLGAGRFDLLLLLVLLLLVVL